MKAVAAWAAVIIFLGLFPALSFAEKDRESDLRYPGDYDLEHPDRYFSEKNSPENFCYFPRRHQAQRDKDEDRYARDLNYGWRMPGGVTFYPYPYYAPPPVFDSPPPPVFGRPFDDKQEGPHKYGRDPSGAKRNGDACSIEPRS